MFTLALRQERSVKNREYRERGGERGSGRDIGKERERERDRMRENGR